ncbi:MAG: hypothetical protein RLZZ519_1600 [Bacteroidota bacterium]
MRFDDWTRAIPLLRERTGRYCHLCEMRVTNPISIDHIFFQDRYDRLRGNWCNFLLVCNYCNSRKGNAQVNSPYRKRYFWPHIHNTLLKFDYLPNGGVSPSEALSTPEDLSRAVRLIDLYKLSAEMTATGDLDERRLHRLQALRIAIDRRIELEKGLCTVEAIVDSAVLSGFFSIWFQVFRDRLEVRKALVESVDFHLQESLCFDEAFMPIERS